MSDFKCEKFTIQFMVRQRIVDGDLHADYAALKLFQESINQIQNKNITGLLNQRIQLL